MFSSFSPAAKVFCLVGSLLAVLSVEIESVFGQRGHQLVIDIRVERIDLPFAFVRGSDQRGPPEGHGEVTVQRLDGRAVQVGGLIDDILAEIEAEKIAHGDLHARFGIAVPISADHYFLQMGGAGRGDGEPDVGDDAGSVGAEQLLSGAGGDGPPIGVAAGPVETRLFERFVVLGARINRQAGWRCRLCGGDLFGRGSKTGDAGQSPEKSPARGLRHGLRGGHTTGLYRFILQAAPKASRARRFVSFLIC